MPSIKKVPIKIIYGDNVPFNTFADATEWNDRERLHIAVKTWVLGWGLAVISVFVPIGHFLLVPAFFIGAPFFAKWRYRTTKKVISGKISCPKCQKETDLAKSYSTRFDDFCSHCREPFHVELS